MEQITEKLKSLATRLNALAAQPLAFIVVAVTLIWVGTGQDPLARFLVGQGAHGQHLGYFICAGCALLGAGLVARKG